MDGLTPWEIASLKVAHHRRDEGHKGYLDRRDFDAMCDECHLGLTHEESDALFAHMDLDCDGRISFQELLNYLTAISFGGGGSGGDNVQNIFRDGSSSSSNSNAGSSDSLGGSRTTSAPPKLLVSSSPSSFSASGGEFYGARRPTDPHPLTAAAAASPFSPEERALLLQSAADMIRLSYASDMSAVLAGGILGLLPLLKSKFFVVVGTLFYDPIRLFRDNIVDYTGSLGNDNASQKATATAYGFLKDRSVPWTTRLRMTFLLCRGLMGVVGWVVFAATLDCTGGVVMFVTYARARQKLLSATASARRRRGEAEGCGSGGDDGVPPLIARLRDFVVSRRYLLEATAGLVGGAAGGFVERPLRYVAHHRILNPSRLVSAGAPRAVAEAFSGCTWAVYRQGISHAIFFAAFSFSHDSLRSLLYRRLQRQRTSWSDACITAVSGCCAGGSYRLVSLPLLNVYNATGGAARPWAASASASVGPRSVEFMSQHATFRGAVRAAYAGLGYSMLWIMPITGAAFLVYERLLVTL